MYHVVIPARFGSTRLPGKALADIAGHPMVYWVWLRARQSNADSVIVATDHEGIAEVMRGYGADVAMTRSNHMSGTDRLAEVAEQRAWSDDTIVVNLQGDEPLMPEANLAQVAQALQTNPAASIATLCEPLEQLDDLYNPSVVKVVVSEAGNALYFSRAPIPFPRAGVEAAELSMRVAQRHVGLYAYRCGFLRRFVSYPQADIEQLESLEQLRAMSQGEVIRVVPARERVPAGVDTPADLEHVRAVMEA
jgi:3-deoxy-manno-octulosonate cytidylyltransferase (CMP-KDO synthetase)